MKTTNEQPKVGNYLAVWEYDGGIWASSFKWENENLMIYNELEGGWEISELYFPEIKIYITNEQ